MNAEGHRGSNDHALKPAIYIDLTTEDVRFFRSFRDAGEFFNAKNPHMFGQVLRGGRGSYWNQVVLRLHQFLAADADEISDLLDHARARRRRGFRPQKTNEQTTPAPT